MINKLEYYVDLWNNFYKSELLDNVHVERVGSFYNISGTTDVVIHTVSPEWSRLITRVERDYFTGAPQNRVMERNAVISELNDRNITNIVFRANISTRISHSSYDYVEFGGSSELDGFIDELTLVNYTTTDGEEYSGDELLKGSVFYKEVLLHFIDSLYKPVGAYTNSLRIIAKRRRLQ